MSRCPAELGWCASEQSAKREREVTVARKPKVQRQCRQIVRMGQLKQRPGKTKLHQVRMQRHALEPAEHVGQVWPRPTRRWSRFPQLHPFLKIRLKKIRCSPN